MRNDSFTVTREMTLLEFLSGVLPGWKKTTLRQYLKNGSVSVNDRVALRASALVKTGDRVSVAAGKSAASQGPGAGLVVRHEDEDIVIVEKPEGLLSVGTEKEKRKTAYFAMSEYLKETSPKNKVFIVHRLDREASGLIVFAKNEEAKFRLQENWDDADKKYLAVVDGVPTHATGTLESKLVTVGVNRVVSDDEDKRGKIAVTRYRVLKAGKEKSLLELQLLTGRKHQIRVHLSDFGHPIVGDEKYGGSRAPRLMLHASFLAFRHPMTGKAMHFESASPFFGKL
jgi:23S rRNA pseudouridine1911/1915/1917 synthase